MANYPSKVKRLGLAKENERGTAELAATIWAAINPDSEIDYKVNLLPDPALRGVMSKYPSTPGPKEGGGSIKFPMRASCIGEFFHMLWGDPVSAEVSTVTITLNTNDYIDFTEDGGAEVSAQLTAGTYAYGTTSATAGTLCALIKTQMEAVNGDSTYTVTYSYTTKKFTITKSAGVFVILWNSGTNKAKSAHTVLGFTEAADTSSLIAQTSDSTSAQWAFLHTFTPASTLLPQSYTLFMDRSLDVKVYNGCNVSSIKISATPADFAMFDASVMCRSEAGSGNIGSPSYTESGALTWQHGTFKIADVSNTEVKNWDIDMQNGLFAKRTTNQSQDVDDLVAVENSVSGSFTVYFENETERTKFLAGTASSIEITLQGAAIVGTTYYKLVILLEAIEYTAFPFGAEDELLAAKATFNAVYYATNSRIARVQLTNIKSSY